MQPTIPPFNTHWQYVSVIYGRCSMQATILFEADNILVARLWDVWFRARAIITITSRPFSYPILVNINRFRRWTSTDSTSAGWDGIPVQVPESYNMWTILFSTIFVVKNWQSFLITVKNINENCLLGFFCHF